MNLLNNAVVNTPKPVNEPIYEYAPGSPERRSLKAALEEMSHLVLEIPLVINGEEIHTGDIGEVVMPHDHRHVMAHYHRAGGGTCSLPLILPSPLSPDGRLCVGRSAVLFF